jgi:hypothetical protein
MRPWLTEFTIFSIGGLIVAYGEKYGENSIQETTKDQTQSSRYTQQLNDFE